MIDLNYEETKYCAGGESCHCVCWRAIDANHGNEVPYGIVEGISLSAGPVGLSLPGSALEICRAKCHLLSMVLRSCSHA